MKIRVEWSQGSLPWRNARKTVFVDMLKVILLTFPICGGNFHDKSFSQVPYSGGSYCITREECA